MQFLTRYSKFSPSVENFPKLENALDKITLQENFNFERHNNFQGLIFSKSIRLAGHAALKQSENLIFGKRKGSLTTRMIFAHCSCC
jgi:hypothetical protein